MTLRRAWETAVGAARKNLLPGLLLQAVMAQAPARGDGLFLPDRPLGSIGAKVALGEMAWG